MVSISSFLEWKSKSEECERDIQEWKRKISAATTNISKHNRQIKSKVSCKGYVLKFQISLIDDLR